MDKKKILELINRRENQILVHSYIYYQCNESLISDDQWTAWAKELCELRDTYPDVYERSDYSLTFDKFEYSTGYDLYGAYTRPEIVRRAVYLLEASKRVHPTE